MKFFIQAIDLTVGLRFSPEEEAMGADYVEHMINFDEPFGFPADPMGVTLASDVNEKKIVQARSISLTQSASIGNSIRRQSLLCMARHGKVAPATPTPP